MTVMAKEVQQEDRINLGAKKFNMWIFIFTSFMLFAAFTSGFIVYSGGKGHGLDVIMPSAFMYSTAVLIISSATLFIASRAAKQLQFARQRLFLWLTFALGMAFFAIQLYAWRILISEGVYFINPNASRSFIYVFSGAHLLHIIAGLIVVGSTISATYKNIPQVKNLYRMEMTSIFWHFLDIIWIYLYVFLLLNQY
jgi:cytochrome c oxidase subunit 3